MSAGNLRPNAGALIGRERDVETVIDDLAAARVVTLTGVGGMGKTRLAVEVGHRLRASWRDGVWFAALDAVDHPGAMVRALLGLLAIEPHSEREVDSLIEGLRFRETLLILDNCEHLLEAAAEVAAAIVSSCPRVRVLATSREPLDIDRERVRRVRSLTTDDDGPAVALFLQRAEEAGAVLGPQRDGPHVVRICRRLDGIPLAIELAAARARSLRPAEIADRLDDMLRLLTGGRRASTERHRTLRATLDWSYDLLSEVERVLLARLSVFAGSFALDAAEAITVGEPVDDDLTVDVIDHLVARSLLVSVDEAQETRFRLLEPVRHLAAEKLAARDETDRIRDRHTQWYLGLILQLDTRWREGDDQGAWPVAARELPNLVAAFDELIDAGRIDDAQRFAVAGFGVINCQFDNIPDYDWAPRATALDPDHVGPHTASAWGMAAWGRSVRGDFEESARWLRHGVAAVEAGSQDDGLLTAAAVFHVWSGGEPVVSDAFLRQSLEAALASGDLHRQVWVLSYAGRPEETLSAAERLGNKTLIALAHAGITGDDDASRWVAAESFWEAAQRSHSFILLNHAAHRLGVEKIRGGLAVDGLLLLRAPLREWLLRADRRVWDVLQSVAWGLAAAGDPVTAARLIGAIGDRDRPLHGERHQLQSLLQVNLDEVERARHRAAGAQLDAGGAVAEAFERIGALTVVAPGDAHGAEVGAPDLTARQLEVADLVARGLTNKQIAQRLGISRFTAETHVRNILERLGAASRSEIATWATRAAIEAPTRSGTRSRT